MLHAKLTSEQDATYATGYRYTSTPQISEAMV